MKVLVIGAGVGGATTGVALQRAGIEALVFERQPRMSADGAGATLWTNAVLALQRIGLADAVAAGGIPLERFQHCLASGRRVAEWPIGDIGREMGAPTVGIVRQRLLGTIVGALRPGSLRFSAECVRVRGEGPRAVATFADGSEESADLVVGADGLRSGVRAQLPGQIEPTHSGITVWRSVIDFDEKDFPPNVFRAHYSRGSHFVAYRVSDGRLHWEAHRWAPEGGTSVSKSDLQAGFAHYCRPVPEMIAATEEKAINRADFYARPPAARWGSGRIVLLGDAAHPMSSYGGQGACQAIEDGVSLATSLASAPDVDAGLERYQSTRMPRTATLLNLNRRLAGMTMARSRIVCAFRDATLPVALSGPALKGHRKNLEPAL